jgi:hypothetical protein
MSCDGRLFQLVSVEGYYHFCNEKAEFSDYGYLVLNKKKLGVIDFDKVNKFFHLDYDGLNYMIYVNNDM